VTKLRLTGLLLLFVASLLGFAHEPLILAALAPGGHFARDTAPPAPDYARLDAWTAHPALDDAADVAAPGLATLPADDARADVFYIHPTTHLGRGWNGPIDDPALNAQTDELATRIQASAWNGCCSVYGPRYRQAHGHAFLVSDADADAAIALAYEDVRAAFRSFLTHTPARAFFVVGHSQGAVLGHRLVREEVVDAGLGDRLVAAYLIGAPLGSIPDLPLCAAPEQTRCWIGWNARGPRFRGSRFELPAEGTPGCVNPLSWRADEARVDARENPGAVFLHAGDGRPLPGFASAQCRDGTLRVELTGRPPRDLASRVLDWVVGPENYHPIEIQLFWTSLRQNAAQRVAAWERAAQARR